MLRIDASKDLENKLIENNENGIFDYFIAVFPRKSNISVALNCFLIAKFNV